MKKIFALFLALFLFTTTFPGCAEDTPELKDPNNEENQPPVQDNANPASDFEYKENEGGGITISKYIGTDADVIIPAQIDGKDVTEIGTSAFYWNEDVVSVIMPDSVLTILHDAFRQCSSLHTVVLSDKITSIKGGAFKECTSLKVISLPDTLTEIGMSAFEKCASLKQIKIPISVRKIGDMAFESSGLEIIEFSEGIEIIDGNAAFAHTKIKQLVLPSSLKEIGTQTFAGCSSLESVTLNEGLATIGYKAFASNPKLEEILIPKTVTHVTEMSFTGCSALRKVFFDGNAPNTFEYSDSILGTHDAYNVSFTIYYHPSAKGFTSPEWYGYPTAIW